jgi:hypothetical protein
MNDLLDLLWRNNTDSGRAVLLLILVLGTIGLACAWWHHSRYIGLERQSLENVRGRLRRAQEARAAAPKDEATPPTTLTVPLEELAEGIPVRTLIGDRLGTIAKMRTARAKINVEALQQSTILKESARWSLALPAYIVSVVMMLGLLGTFIGLSYMVVDIHKALPEAGTDADSSKWAESVSSLGRILAGKKTAFSATLAGIFLSIVVSAFNFGLARAQSAFYDSLERFTAEELLPATMPAFDDETPWEKLSTQLGDSFEHLQKLTIDQARSVEQMAAVEKVFGTVIENIERITQRAATAPLQGLTGEMTNVIGQLTEVNSAVVGLTAVLPQVLSSFRQTHQATLKEIQSAMQAQQVTLERLMHSMQHNERGARGGNLTFAAVGAAAVLLIILLLQQWG